MVAGSADGISCHPLANGEGDYIKDLLRVSIWTLLIHPLLPRVVMPSETTFVSPAGRRSRYSGACDSSRTT
jgi:hypothetical protein